MISGVGPFSASFESGFLSDFWFRALVGPTIFFETFFDLVLVLRVFFFAIVFTSLSHAGLGLPRSTSYVSGLRLLIRSDESSSQLSEG